MERARVEGGGGVDVGGDGWVAAGQRARKRTGGCQMKRVGAESNGGGLSSQRCSRGRLGRLGRFTAPRWARGLVSRRRRASRVRQPAGASVHNWSRAESVSQRVGMSLCAGRASRWTAVQSGRTGGVLCMYAGRGCCLALASSPDSAETLPGQGLSKGTPLGQLIACMQRPRFLSRSRSPAWRPSPPETRFLQSLCPCCAAPACLHPPPARSPASAEPRPWPRRRKGPAGRGQRSAQASNHRAGPLVPGAGRNCFLRWPAGPSQSHRSHARAATVRSACVAASSGRAGTCLGWRKRSMPAALPSSSTPSSCRSSPMSPWSKYSRAGPLTLVPPVVRLCC